MPKRRYILHSLRRWIVAWIEAWAAHRPVTSEAAQTICTLKSVLLKLDELEGKRQQEDVQ